MNSPSTWGAGMVHFAPLHNLRYNLQNRLQRAASVASGERWNRFFVAHNL